MFIPEWVPVEKQFCQLGRHVWSVARLIELSKDLPVMRVPLLHLNVYQTYKNLTLREMAMHIQAVQAADLQYPIILDEDGELMDGRHRILKAMLQRRKSILAVRFLKNPSPCSVKED